MDGMNNNWSLVFTTTLGYQAAIIKGRLEENNIPVIVLNRQDSSYLVFGDIEVYVPRNFEDVARNLVENALIN